MSEPFFAVSAVELMLRREARRDWETLDLEERAEARIDAAQS